MNTAPRFAIGAHVHTPAGRCGTVRSCFQSIHNRWAYGVLYDDHETDFPVGSSGHAYAEHELEHVQIQIEEA